MKPWRVTRHWAQPPSMLTKGVPKDGQRSIFEGGSIRRWHRLENGKQLSSYTVIVHISIGTRPHWPLYETSKMPVGEVLIVPLESQHTHCHPLGEVLVVPLSSRHSWCRRNIFLPWKFHHFMPAPTPSHAVASPSSSRSTTTSWWWRPLHRLPFRSSSHIDARPLHRRSIASIHRAWSRTIEERSRQATPTVAPQVA